MLYSVFLALSVILDPFFESLGVDHSQVSIIGGVFVVAGVFSSLLFGLLLDKYRKYLLITRILCFGSLIVLAGCFGTFREGSIWIIGASAIVIGILIVPILPVGISFAGELTFPM